MHREKDSLRDRIALGVLLTIAAAYLAAAFVRIHAIAADPVTARRMIADDARHYLEIAEDLRAGHWRMRYVTPGPGPDLAHRQPLYPAFLALASSLLGTAPARLCMLNAVLVVAAMAVVYAIGQRLLGSRAAGLCGAAALYQAPFLWEIVTTRLLTEPGFVLIALGLGFYFLRYLGGGYAGDLFAIAALAALAYLQRINGLFIGLAALAWCFAADWSQLQRRPAVEPRGPAAGATMLRRHGVALAVFVLVATPSWLPRLVHAGNPLYHGYLTNFMWTDSYEQAHQPGPARFRLRDYARKHDAGDAVQRMAYGLRRTLYQTPRDKYGKPVALAMLTGVLLTAAARDRRVLSWLAVGLLQMLPLAWTALSNPNRRIPATALLPFGIVALVAGVAIVVQRFSSRSIQR